MRQVTNAVADGGSHLLQKVPAALSAGPNPAQQGLVHMT